MRGIVVVSIDLGGRVAVVTGAASGIGRASARQLADCGARVVVADLDLEGATSTVEDIRRAGGEAKAVRVDVADQDSVRELQDRVRADFGEARLLVNCAGWDRIEPFVESNPETWKRIVDINYLGTVSVTHAFLDGMLEGSGGKIVNVASDAGRVGSTGEAVYAGAKGAVIAFSKSIARELARFGVVVNCVSPGPTDTPLFRAQPEKMQDALIRAIPLRRLAEPDEIARVIVLLGSDAISFMTGQVVSVSGGLTMAD